MTKYLKANWPKMVANACIILAGCLAIQYGPALAQKVLNISLVKHSAMGLWCVAVGWGMVPGPFPENVASWLSNLISSK